jgi:photosynthetic reaction center cytochrome c subunit
MNKNLFVHGASGVLGMLTVMILAPGALPPSLHAQAPAAGPPNPPPLAADMKGKTAEQFYKKIEVLKGIPAEQIHPAMEYITVALGVGCGYCHVIGHFDSDDKREKHVARSMMVMTMALDNNVFDGKRELTCYTCHRGQAKAASTQLLAGDKAPTEASATEVFPPSMLKDMSMIDSKLSPSKAPATVVSGPAPAPKPAAPAAPLPSVEEVFSKYEQALGGKAAFAKITSLSYTGTADMLVPPPPVPQGAPLPGPPTMGTVPAEHYVKAPKGVISVVFPGRGPNSMGFDGTIGWHNTPIREDTGDELRMIMELGETVPGLEFRRDHSNVQVSGMEKIADRDTYRVVGTRSEGFPVIDFLNFDTQSGLLVRSYTTMQSVIGAFPEDTFYEDYRDVSGVKVAFTWRVVSAEGNRTYKWAQVNANAPVEDAKFTKPTPPPPAAPRPAD